MFIGMDIYKDSAQKNMSVASFVASINGKQENKLSCTRYYSRCMLQPRGSEFCNGLNVFMMGLHLIYTDNYEFSIPTILNDYLNKRCSCEIQ